MKLIQYKRRSTYKKYYSSKMGMLNAKVISIKKYVLGFPVKTLHQYRETYYGKIKDCKDCNLYA